MTVGLKPRILYVDDSKNNLIGFEGQFGDQFEVITMSDPDAALTTLTKIPFTLILSDQRMPKMSGVEFLGKTIAIQPNAIRIIFTGYSEEVLVIDAIRVGKVHDYIRKPCTDEELEKRLHINYALYEENMKKFEEIEALKREVLKLKK